MGYKVGFELLSGLMHRFSGFLPCLLQALDSLEACGLSQIHLGQIKLAAQQILMSMMVQTFLTRSSRFAWGAPAARSADRIATRSRGVTPTALRARTTSPRVTVWSTTISRLLFGHIGLHIRRDCGLALGGADQGAQEVARR